MGIKELALLAAAQQLAMAVAAYLARISPPPANPWAAAAVAVGQGLADNAAVALANGVSAAAGELLAAQSGESSVSSVLQQLKPIR